MTDADACAAEPNKFSRDGWITSDSENCWYGYNFKAYNCVNGFFSAFGLNAWFSLAAANVLFSVLSVNAICSLLSVNSCFSILSVNSVCSLFCHGGSFEICL